MKNRQQFCNQCPLSKLLHKRTQQELKVFELRGSSVGVDLILRAAFGTMVDEDCGREEKE